MALQTFSFNGFQFDNVIDGHDGYLAQNWDVSSSRRITTQIVPRSDLGLQQDAGRGPTTHRITVHVFGSTEPLVRQYLRNIISNCDGTLGQLSYDTDFYWWARLKTFSYTYLVDEIALGMNVTLEFESADPYCYSVTPQNYGFGPFKSTGLLNTAISIQNTGDAYNGRGLIGPIWTLTGPFANGVTVTNTAPGYAAQFFSITPTSAVVAGSTTLVNPLALTTSVVTINTGTQVVTQNTFIGASSVVVAAASAAVENYFGFTGDSFTNGFILLYPGVNNITVSNTISGNNTGNMTLGFTPRNCGWN